MTSPTRREAIAAALATSALAALPARAAPTPCAAPAAIDAVGDTLLAHLPEIAVYTGAPAALDGGPLARRMDDWHPAALEDYRGALGEAEIALDRLSCPGDPRGTGQIAVARAVVANGTRTAAIGYGRPNPFWYSGHLPYVVTQVAGPHIQTPDDMAAKQSLATPQAVDAWLEKLDGFPRGFDGVIAKLRADEAAGCRPPKLLLHAALGPIDAFLAGPADAHPLVIALRDRTAAARLDTRLRDAAVKRATTAIDRRARPAFAKLRAAVADLATRGRDDHGIWAQPDGDALYAANIRALADSTQPPAEIHRIGLAEVRRIAAEMDRLLRLEGLTQGSIGARMTALAARPDQHFPDDEAGRAALLDHVRALVAGAEARYPAILPPALVPRQSLDVRRVPPEIEAGAPGAYYDPPALDGSRPGTYWLNLRDPAANPRLGLPTVTYHEGVPGHHTQNAIAVAQGDTPVMLRIAAFNAFAEGWGLYAERLMAELGAYAQDRPADLGRLQDEMLRAVRLVVDTGLHALRWDHDRAIRYMLDEMGAAPSEAKAEVERYMAWPGQALGYKLGQLRLLSLRETMRKRLARRFTLPRFHAAVLAGGAMPLDMIAARVARG